MTYFEYPGTARSCIEFYDAKDSFAKPVRRLGERENSNLGTIFINIEGYYCYRAISVPPNTGMIDRDLFGDVHFFGFRVSTSTASLQLISVSSGISSANRCATPTLGIESPDAGSSTPPLPVRDARSRA